MQCIHLVPQKACLLYDLSGIMLLAFQTKGRLKVQYVEQKLVDVVWGAALDDANRRGSSQC